ncbi:hypothetical protein C6P45_000518 [Maudiozyma exigua]|uniref:Uncharacterized protein n=1 Tax=Maudiozyma exigua TaxID=34358 RepID=A0A9P7B7W7_MAUEX|nr:hypothetical protein C6P45_000518 [Kazachstania exigua]
MMDIELELGALFTRNEQNIIQEPKFWLFYQGWYYTALLDTANDRIYIFTIENDISARLLSATLNLENVTKQCGEQGIESKDSVKQIWEKIKKSLRQTGLDSFTVSDLQIKFSLSITKMMKVFFAVSGIELHDGTAVCRVLSSLVKYVICITTICLTERQGLLKVIEDKDKTIDYLAFLVKDLGGNEVLERRAPIEFMANSTSGKFNGNKFRNQLLKETPTDVSGDIEPLNIFSIGKKYVNNNGNTRDDSPVISLNPETDKSNQFIDHRTLTQPQTSQKLAARFSHICNNKKQSLIRQEDKELSRALSSSHSPSPSRASKKRKFGKINTKTEK